jgi:hypothetical protein
VRRLGLILLATLALAVQAVAAPARAGDVQASAPKSLSVTIYRAPFRRLGSIDLDQLGGFALVTETRTVNLPAGESRLRFEGVVDGIQPASAIVTGLPGGVIEKNRDAALLSPETLVRAAVDSDVTLVRTNPKTGVVTRTPATIRSANDQGVVFQTAEGIEALTCSGLPESFQFSRIPAGLSSTPTLSALVRTDRPITATVTLSYLADGFDWAASYVAHINPNGRTLDLIAWITLANGNGVSLPGASTQIVAGKLNQVGDDSSPAWDQPTELARCWPQGSTSDVSDGNDTAPAPMAAADSATEVGEVVVTAEKREMNIQKVPIAVTAFTAAQAEQLGDLKLYRLPEPTTVAAQESKQVKMLDQPGVLFTRLCIADLPAAGAEERGPAGIMLRTKNSLKNKLGLPLPAGEVTVFDPASGRNLLVGEAGLHDTAVDEDIELMMGDSPDVQVRQTKLSYKAKAPELLLLTPKLALALRHGETVEEVEITSARAEPTPFELRLQTPGTVRVAAADQPMAKKDGRPIFRLSIPANGSIKLHYVVAE